MADSTIQGHQANGGASKRGAPDPSVAVPDGVKAAASRADALIEQARVAKAANDANGGNELVRPLVPPPPRPNPNIATGNYDPNNPQPPEIGSHAPPPAPQPPAPQQVTAQNDGDWEHQFKSLKGRYEREQEDKRRLQQTLVDQQRLLAQVGSSAPVQDSGLRFDVRPPPPGRRVTQKEIDEFGTELMDVVGRRAAEVYEPLLQQVANELQQVKRQVGGVQNTVVFDARVKMYDDLARALPQWDAINNSPQFAQWLDTVDPISHRTRREFLNVAHNSNQTGQVIDIFNAFLGAHGAGNGNGQAPGNGQTPSPQLDLTLLAAPGRAKSGQTQAPPEKGIVTRAEIKQFYTDKTQGKYAGREPEAASIERQIFDAGNEGRIR